MQTNFIEEKNEKYINSVAEIFNALAQNRNSSISRTQMIEKSTIPENIRETNPKFWDLFEKNSSFIFELLEKKSTFSGQIQFSIEIPRNFDIQNSICIFQKENKIEAL